MWDRIHILGVRLEDVANQTNIQNVTKKTVVLEENTQNYIGSHRLDYTKVWTKILGLKYK